MLIFALAAALLNKRFCHGRLLTFDRLNEDEISALKKVKAKLLEPSLLALSHPHCDYTVGKDAFHKQIGFVVLQM